MRKLILITVTIACCSFTVFAQKEQILTIEQVPAVEPEVEGDVFTSVEQMPEYPGGTNSLMKYLSKNVVYPEKAKKDNIQGSVIVKFVVSKSGKVRNAVLLKDIGFGCGEEALRVVSSMPDWKPGKQNGKPVNVYFTLPVRFRK